MDDIVRYVKFSGLTWTHNDKGFFYQRYPVAEEDKHGKDTDDHSGTETNSNEFAKLYYHRVGTPQSEDILIMEDPEQPMYMFYASITLDSKYIILGTSRDTSPSSLTWIAELPKGEITKETTFEWKKIVDEWRSATHDYIANDGTSFYFHTNDNAPKYKVVTYDLEKPEEGFVDHIPEDPDSILTSAFVVAQDRLIVIRSKDVKDTVHVHDLSTGKRESRIGEHLIGSFGEISGRREVDELFFKVIAFNNPGIVYRYDFKAEQSEEKLWRSTVVKGLKPEEFETEQVFYASKDGTKVPMFITTPKGTPKDGTAPLLLYGYGGKIASEKRLADC